MIDTKKIPTSILTGTNVEGENKEDELFVMFYRTNIAGAFQFKIFRHSGTMRTAHDRAAAHCKLMRYRLMYVSTFVADLEADEKDQVAPQGQLKVG